MKSCRFLFSEVLCFVCLQNYHLHHSNWSPRLLPRRCDPESDFDMTYLDFGGFVTASVCVSSLLLTIFISTGEIPTGLFFFISHLIFSCSEVRFC